MSRTASHLVDLAPRCIAGVDVVRIASERSFPRHAHDQFGIGVMRSGGHASWSGLGQVEAGPGDVIAVSPEEIHDGAPIGSYRAWDMIYIEPKVVADFVGTTAAASELGFAARRAPNLADAVVRACELVSIGDANAAEEALTLLLADLLRPGTATGGIRVSTATNRVLARIRDCPEAPPSLDEVAALMDMGRTGALRRFQREVGATPHAYAMQLRLRLARRALVTGDRPSDVALDLGFADQSHLTRWFGRQYGVPPGRYRAAGANIVQDRE